MAIARVTTLTALDMSYRRSTGSTPGAEQSRFALHLAAALLRLKNLQTLAIDELLTPCTAGLAMCRALPQLPRLQALRARGACLSHARMEQLGLLVGCALCCVHAALIEHRP